MPDKLVMNFTMNSDRFPTTLFESMIRARFGEWTVEDVEAAFDGDRWTGRIVIDKRPVKHIVSIPNHRAMKLVSSSLAPPPDQPAPPGADEAPETDQA